MLEGTVRVVPKQRRGRLAPKVNIVLPVLPGLLIALQEQGPLVLDAKIKVIAKVALPDTTARVLKKRNAMLVVIAPVVPVQVAQIQHKQDTLPKQDLPRKQNVLVESIASNRDKHLATNALKEPTVKIWELVILQTVRWVTIAPRVK